MIETFQTNIKRSACHQRYDVTVAQQLQTASTELSYFAAGVCVPSQNLKCLPPLRRTKKLSSLILDLTSVGLGADLSQLQVT